MVNIAKLTKKKLGELLVAEGLLNEAQIQEALSVQRESGELLGEVLVKLGYVTESDIARSLARQFGLPYLDASKYLIDRDAVELLPIDAMVENQLIPLDRIGEVLIIATAGVLNESLFEELEKRTGGTIHLYISTLTQVMQAIKTHVAPAQKGTT